MVPTPKRAGAQPTLTIIFLMACAVLVAGCQPEDSTARGGIDIIAALGGTADDDYARATVMREFRFPDDHAAHPDFRNEWWYFTGHLRDDNGQLYGFQVTFFRIAIWPRKPASTSDWAGNQVWMAHAAVTDVAAERHREAERFARGALQLAGASTNPLQVWLGDWQLKGEEEETSWRLSLRSGTFSIDLSLRATKPVVLQGDQGLSQKSDEPGNATYYYSITRLDTAGELTIDGRVVPVSGFSWFDREWGTSALAPDQAGWDWFSLQLESGEDLMFYRLRNDRGEPYPGNRGSWVDERGRSKIIRPEHITLTPLEWWQGESGKRYPVRWRVQYPEADGDWVVSALLPDQEMNLSVVYWEGLMEVSDYLSGDIVGHGYLEMTGY